MKEAMEISSILKEFHKISGFRISIHDPEFNEIYSYPQRLSAFCRRIQEIDSIKKSCRENDAAAFERVRTTESVYIYKCRCGLYEAVAPLYSFGVLSGYLMMGQVRDEKEASRDYITQNIKQHFNSAAEAEKYVADIKSINEELIYSYINIMTVIAEYITASNKLDSYTERLAPLIKKYINQNYSQKITLAILSQKFGCCNSTLMNCFKREYSISINSYLTDVRLQKAEAAVRMSVKPFKEIAAECGFYDQNYFSKLFTAKYGCCPVKYRKNATDRNTVIKPEKL